MAVIISYERNGKTIYVQKGILCDISLLDKPRIWVDFNETCADDLYFLSQVDIIRDSNGNEIELTENMENSIGYQTLRNDDCMISEKDKVFFSQ